jgi:hypothetical protein
MLNSHASTAETDEYKEKACNRGSGSVTLSSCPENKKAWAIPFISVAKLQVLWLQFA